MFIKNFTIMAKSEEAEDTDGSPIPHGLGVEGPN